MIKNDILSIYFTDKDLCCRCGTCIGICPTGALSLGEGLYPAIDPDKCDDCGLCAKTCPGGKVHFKYLTKVTFGHEKTSDHFDGHVEKILVGHALDYLIQLYMPKRCQTCIDGSNEFSDISVSDVWTRDSQGRYKFRMHSKILVRTEKGQQIIQGAQNNKSVYINDVSNDSSYKTHRLQTKRKGISAPLRVARLTNKGKPAPEYDRTISDATTKEKIMEQATSFVLWMGHYPSFRYPLVNLLTSRYGIPSIKFRNFMKKRKYRRML